MDMWSKSSARNKAPNESSELSVDRGESMNYTTPITSTPARDPNVKIGKSIVVRGEVAGDEDLVVEGKVEGVISLEDHHLTVGETGSVSAEVTAKTVTIIGRMEGNLIAKEKAEIAETGSLKGDIKAPRIVIADGAKFKGSVDMSSENGPTLRNPSTVVSSSKQKKVEVSQQESLVSEPNTQKGS